MSKNITIVMYHYVREIKKSKYPNIKGLELKEFKNQLNYLNNKYNIISAELMTAYIIGDEKKLPKNSCLLTFDDGYKDHIKYVLPELKKRKLSGCFFPIGSSIKEKKVLDVNAIQFILACNNNLNNLLVDLINELKKNYLSEKQIDQLWKKNAIPSIYDNKETVFFKKILQRELKQDLRKKIIKKLFKKYVNKSLNELNKELYMSSKDLKTLLNEKMNIGNHSYNHCWLESISKNLQKKEINQSLFFLKEIGVNINNWIMCYPYGSYNQDTIKILKENKCLIGLTTNSGVAKLNKQYNLELKRLDTNNFIK